MNDVVAFVKNSVPLLNDYPHKSPQMVFTELGRKPLIHDYVLPNAIQAQSLCYVSNFCGPHISLIIDYVFHPG
jgi:hypothetical protein